MEKFLDRFAAQASQHAEQIAVTDQFRHLSYSQLDVASNRLAWQLLGNSATANQIIGYLGRMTVDCVTKYNCGCKGRHCLCCA